MDETERDRLVRHIVSVSSRAPLPIPARRAGPSDPATLSPRCPVRPGGAGAPPVDVDQAGVPGHHPLGLAPEWTGGEGAVGAARRRCVPACHFPPAWHAAGDIATHVRSMSYVVAAGLRATVPARIRAGPPNPRPPSPTDRALACAKPIHWVVYAHPPVRMGVNSTRRFSILNAPADFFSKVQLLASPFLAAFRMDPFGRIVREARQVQKERPVSVCSRGAAGGDCHDSPTTHFWYVAPLPSVRNPPPRRPGLEGMAHLTGP
jgi:hypothetical protein